MLHYADGTILEEHLSNGNTLRYKTENGTAYNVDTPEAVVGCLEWARRNDARVRVFYGDTDKADFEKTHGKAPDVGRDWGECYGVTGTIGRSTGRIQIPLMIANRRSTGGNAILTDCIVRIIVNGREVYRHPRYHQPDYSIGAPGEICKGSPEYKAGVYADGDNVANFRSQLAAVRWVTFMTGSKAKKAAPVEKSMNTFTACMICEGMEEANEETTIQAWQSLIDSGVVWQLQGFYGRTAAQLIDAGVCTR